MYNVNMIQFNQLFRLKRYQHSLISTHFLKQSILLNALTESPDISIIFKADISCIILNSFFSNIFKLKTSN